MREMKKRKDKVAIALVLCFCVVALTSVFAVKSSLDKIKAGAGNTEIANAAKAPAAQDSQVSKQTPVVDSEETKAQEEKSEHPAAPYIMPVSGKVALEYSMDMPIYSKTLDQYMTHPGMDIEAPMSAPVRAAAGGTVTKVGQNDRYGMTVEIDHGDGVISAYSNLAETDLAESGDVVSQGDKIGIVGETALFELLEVPHLHFEMTKSGSYVNPADYVSAAQN